MQMKVGDYVKNPKPNTRGDDDYVEFRSVIKIIAGMVYYVKFDSTIQLDKVSLAKFDFLGYNPDLRHNVWQFVGVKELTVKHIWVVEMNWKGEKHTFETIAPTEEKARANAVYKLATLLKISVPSVIHWFKSKPFSISVRRM
jgi:hypothetical protein